MKSTDPLKCAIARFLCTVRLHCQPGTLSFVPSQMFFSLVLGANDPIELGKEKRQCSHMCTCGNIMKCYSKAMIIKFVALFYIFAICMQNDVSLFKRAPCATMFYIFCLRTVGEMV